MSPILNADGDARAPVHARDGQYWLVFDSGRYLADHGAAALEAALDELRAAGLTAEPYEGRDDCVWVEGPKPSGELWQKYQLHPPGDDHPVGPVSVVIATSRGCSPT